MKKKYLNDYDFEKYLVKYRRQNVIEIMSHYPHKRILEIGCGIDPLFTHIESDFERYVIVEPGDLFYENASRLASVNNKVLCYHSFFEDIADKLLIENFDYIIISSLIHELSSPNLLIESVMKVCNSGTTVYINVPNAKSLHRILAMESKLITDIHDASERNITMQQHSVFDIDSLVSLITSVVSDINIIEKGSYFVKPFSHKQMSECLSNDIIDEKIIDGFNRIIKYMPELGSEIYLTFRV